MNLCSLFCIGCLSFCSQPKAEIIVPVKADAKPATLSLSSSAAAPGESGVGSYGADSGYGPVTIKSEPGSAKEGAVVSNSIAAGDTMAIPPVNASANAVATKIQSSSELEDERELLALSSIQQSDR